MKFPARPTRVRVGLAAVCTAIFTAALTAGVVSPSGTAAAQPPPPRMFNVKYTVWAEQLTPAEIYYREVDPPNYGEYSHNPYRYSPKAEAQVGPDLPWIREVTLADPQNWAMVIGTKSRALQPAAFHCELAIDGVVVLRNQGPKGALCSMRNW